MLSSANSEKIRAEELLLRFFPARPGIGAAFLGVLGVGAGVVELLLGPLAAEGQGLLVAQVQRQVDLAVGGQVAQGGGVEAGVVGVEDTFGAAGQAFVDPAVAGLLVLQVGQRAAEVPFAAMGDRVGLAVHAVGLVAEHLLHVVVAVGVLRVAGVDVALAAEAGLELEGLLGRQAPAEQPVDVLVAHAFATGGEGAGLLAGAVGFVAGVDVPVVRVGLGDVAVDAVAEVFRERPVETEAHPFAGAFGLVLREIAVDAEITVGFRAGLLGDDVHHAARRAVAVARRRRAADHFDALDLVGRHPVGVAAAVALAAPAVAHRVARADRLCRRPGSGCSPGPCRGCRSAGCFHAGRWSCCRSG